MKATGKLFLTALTLAALTAGAWAQTQVASNASPEASSAAPAAPAPAITAADIQALKDALAAQQRQIQALQDQLQHKNLQADQSSPDAPANAGQTAANPSQQVAELGTGVAPQDNPPSQAPEQESSQTYDKQMEGPLTIHFRGVNFTPGGYAEGAFIHRSRALAADVPTPFNSLTMPGASQSQMSEFFGTGRQSKITSFVDGRLKNVDLSSYVSADFLSAGVTSTPTQTNSYTLRLRQFWAQAKFTNGWSFLGGQSWSLLTENGKGISPDDDTGRTNDARPKTIDPSYNVGFVFARQYGLRLTKSFGDTVAVAVAIENPQATITTHNNGANYLLGENGASNSYNTTTSYSFNPSPDIIAKVAFDPGFGHYEAFGLFDRFADRVFPCGEVGVTATCGGQAVGVTSAFGAYDTSKSGGGVGASARWDFAKHLVFGLKGFGGGGVGRYGPGGLPDVSINPDGTLHIVKNLIGLTTLEYHEKKFDIYGYGGAEYAARTWGFDPTVVPSTTAGAAPKAVGDVGYGAPGFNNTGCFVEQPPTAATSATSGTTPGSLAHCASDTRTVIEGTVGFWYRFYSGPRGKFQFGTQYSYVTRNTWSGNGGLAKGSAGLQPNGIDNMIFTSFRYYLP